MSNVQHSSESAEWYTPSEYVEAARRVLGGIDLDPASCAEANKTVQARHWFGKDDNALTRPWGVERKDIHKAPRIFMNPPGGKVGNTSLPQLFWSKLLDESERRFTRGAIVVCFSIEQLQNTQCRSYPSMCDFPVCIPSKRIHFKAPGTPKKRSSPSHANAIVYVQGTANRSDEFACEFSKFGSILYPRGMA